MTSITIPGSPRVLADTVGTRHRVLADVALIALGVVLVAALAQVEVPMFPVPITGQTLGVVIVGATLGARRGAISLFSYMVLGLAGLPIFAGFTGGPLAVLKPSFGFVIGFIAAAFVVGKLAERKWDRNVGLALLAFLGASLIPFAFGLPYLAVALGLLGLPNDFASVMAAGFTPFIIGGIIKAAIAAGVVPLVWQIVAFVKRDRD
jgi:biotin transport system substrate-specific component